MAVSGRAEDGREDGAQRPRGENGKLHARRPELPAALTQALVDVPFEDLVYGKLGAHFDSVGPAGTRDLHAFVVAQVERALIRHALDTCGGNRLRASELLGLHRNTLRRKMRELDLDAEQHKR